jgi:hypothetical protein
MLKMTSEPDSLHLAIPIAGLGSAIRTYPKSTPGDNGTPTNLDLHRGIDTFPGMGKPIQSRASDETALVVGTAPLFGSFYGQPSCLKEAAYGQPKKLPSDR